MAASTLKYWTVDPSECVQIRMGKEGPSAEEPLTIPESFIKAADAFPDHPALVYEDQETKQWTTVSYSLVYCID